MSSGRQQGELNTQAFAAWAVSKTDDDFLAIANRSVLSRTEARGSAGSLRVPLNRTRASRPHCSASPTAVRMTKGCTGKAGRYSATVA